MTYCFSSRNNDRVGMVPVNHEIDTFVCYVDDYVAVVYCVNIMRDLLKYYRKILTDCVKRPFDYNVLSVPATSITGNFVY